MLPTSFLFLLVATAIPSPAEEPTTDAQSTGVLAARIDLFLAKYDLTAGQIGVIVRDGATGRVLYARSADRPLKPASNNKILTTAAALHVLGRDYRYRTLVALRGAPTSDTLRGDLVVVGSGDPSISGRFVPDHDRKAIFRRWAELLLQRGIRRIAGDVVGIDDAFDDQPQAPGWPAEDRGEWYCAEVSALTYNEGCVDIRWQGTNGRDNEPATFDLIPPTRYVQLVNFVTTARGKDSCERYYERAEKKNAITARGRVAEGEPVFDSATVANPTLFFVTVLTETLRESGIEVGGSPRDADDLADKSLFRRSLDPLTYYESPPLSQLIEVVNRNSQNLFAEQIFKTLGKHAADEGSFGAGARAVQQYMASLGVDCRGLSLVDGSGLSHLNRVTPAQLAAVLLAVDRTPDGPLFRETLPQGGQNGSLRKRFQDTVRLRQAGLRVRAKTGYIRGCHALSGWVETRAGQAICLSILCNDLPMTDEQTKLFIEHLVECVAELKEKC
jgi:D-alanyl-D-alanine carboxypeptidase/D-alanyl-D-alanine-endopeptidase (penicillin-binding protein 4)